MIIQSTQYFCCLWLSFFALFFWLNSSHFYFQILPLLLHNGKLMKKILSFSSYCIVDFTIIINCCPALFHSFKMDFFGPLKFIQLKDSPTPRRFFFRKTTKQAAKLVSFTLKRRPLSMESNQVHINKRINHAYVI